MSLHKEANKYFLNGNYVQAISLYEKAVQTDPNIISHYWYLGLAYIFQEQEELAQTTWLYALAQGTNEEIEQWTQELVEVLEIEAQRQVLVNNFEKSWLVRQHIRELVPSNINNLLHLIKLSIDLSIFSVDLLKEIQIKEFIESEKAANINTDLLLEILIKVLDFHSQITLDFLEAALPHAELKEKWVDILTTSAIKIADQMSEPSFAAKVVELCFKVHPTNIRSLQYLCLFHGKSGNFQSSFDAAKQLFELCDTLSEKLLGSYLMTEAFIKAGDWLNATSYINSYKAMMKEFIEENPDTISDSVRFSLILIPSLLAYLQDEPKENNWFQLKIAHLFRENLKAFAPPLQTSSYLDSSRPLKIGYIGHTLRAHSVGWLSRWLFHYHNKELFETGIYFVNQNSDNDFSRTWFKDKVSFYRELGINPQEIVEQIQKDKIDILVDLDSTTFNGTCMVMAFRAAPIQITWLGKDASEISSIDYFMADPYVLPTNAQDYYQEKIWRLPQTYIAVDGFEIGTPTLRRDHLGLPSNAIVYLSAQIGLKRHPDTIRLQMKVLKEVKNSYLLVKGRSDETVIQKLFTTIAEEEGVESNRLRFLTMAPNEYIHRANLQIADVILDTYPYNGATTTLEALWVGVPLVTKVGQQFAARNSYTFLMNVGVTEGIAWTDEEYIQWGIRLGQDEVLRQQVTWKLKRSRQTSPLWNAKQFTREIENAYQSMWGKYIQQL